MRAGRTALVRNRPVHSGKTRGGKMDLFSPLKNMGRALGVPNVLGNFTTIDSVHRTVAHTGAGGFFAVVTWTPSSVRMVTINNQKTIGIYEQPHLDELPPTTIRPMRQSITVRNITKSDCVQGVVRALCVPDSLEWEFNAAATTAVVSDQFYLELSNMMSTDKRVVTHSAASLTKGKTWIAPPASYHGMIDNVPYYPKYSATATAPEIKSYVEGVNLAGAQAKGLHCVVMWFEGYPGTDGSQAYDIAVRSQDACNFPTNTLAGSLARPAPPPHTQWQSQLANAHYMSAAGHAESSGAADMIL